MKRTSVFFRTSKRRSRMATRSALSRQSRVARLRGRLMQNANWTMARVQRKSSAKPAGNGKQQSRLWLMYPPRLITTPVIWELGRRFPLITNVRQASVTDEIGIVCLELEGERAHI